MPHPKASKGRAADAVPTWKARAGASFAGAGGGLSSPSKAPVVSPELAEQPARDAATSASTMLAAFIARPSFPSTTHPSADLQARSPGPIKGP